MDHGYEVFHPDPAVLVDFYVDVLGFTREDPSDDDLDHVVVRRDQLRVGCTRHPDAPLTERKPPYGSEIVLRVEDVGAEHGRVVRAGWPVADTLQERPWGMSDFRFFDPSGQYIRITDGLRAGATLQRVAAYGICVNEAQEILLSHYDGGLWTLPGGGVEHGEHPSATVVREVKEETGFDCRVVELLGTESAEWVTADAVAVHSVNLVFRVELVGGALRHEVGGTSDRAGWVSVDGLDSFPHTELVDQALAVCGGS